MDLIIHNTFYQDDCHIDGLISTKCGNMIIFAKPITIGAKILAMISAMIVVIHVKNKTCHLKIYT